LTVELLKVGTAGKALCVPFGRARLPVAIVMGERAPHSVLLDLTPGELSRLARQLGRAWCDAAKDPAGKIRIAPVGPYTVEYQLASRQDADASWADALYSVSFPEAIVCIHDVHPMTPEERSVFLQAGGPIGGPARQAAVGSPDSRMEPAPIDLPKVPSLVQQQIDQLIEQRKHGQLEPGDEAALNELLDYLDDLTYRELSHLAETHGM